MNRIIVVILIFIMLFCSCNSKNNKTDNQKTEETTQSTTLEETWTAWTDGTIKNTDVDFPIDIQLNEIDGNTYLCRIEEDGTFLLKQFAYSMDVAFDNGFNNDDVRIYEDSTKEKISKDICNKIKELVISLTKVRTYYWATGTRTFIYTGSNSKYMVIDNVSGKKSTKYLAEIIDLLNDNTSLNIDEEYY